MNGPQKDKIHVKWDEETIAKHDLERGTRMKIEEPNTPYHYYASDQEEEEAVGTCHVEAVSPARSLSGKEGQSAIEWNELTAKLECVKRKKSEWDSGSEDEFGTGIKFAERDAEGKKIVKDPKFAAKRKTHYNEFQMMKQWKESHLHEKDDEEDEDENDNDDHNEVAEISKQKETVRNK